jgi:hypothetical protein
MRASKSLKPANADLAIRILENRSDIRVVRDAYTVESSSAGELVKVLEVDTERWEALIKTTGIKID